ncbi:MAG: hypothetical protein IT342_23055 [Candidatus Melainabacteria bacterium]|nr:hypothetical protein [Candidatus Melainabacteria bacterium]
MLKINRALPVIMSALIVFSAQPSALAGDGLNFKIYNPETSAAPQEEAASSKDAPAGDFGGLKEETPTEDKLVEEAPKAAPETETAKQTATETPFEPASTSSESTSLQESTTQPIESLIDPEVKKEADAAASPKKATQKQVLQGFVRVVPQGTKIPIIMDTAVDSDTSQEGDEFAARTAEDLNIDGQITVPAGSIIKGRIARITLPRALNRSGHVALKFDTVTTPDNKQIPIVANLVARGGVVHAKRGLKDVAIDVGAVTLPVGVGLGIGLIAGNASSASSIGAGGGAMIGAGVGAAIGLAVLLSKKGKRVDVRPGDELKIELAEELAMPTM